MGYGINQAHIDFKAVVLEKRIEWLYTPLIKRAREDTPTEVHVPFYGDHSTATASKAVGMMAGAAQHATLVVVKMYPGPKGFLEAWETVMQDIAAKGRTHHSVVTLSYIAYRKTMPLEQKTTSAILMLARRGVPIFMPSGNDGPGFVTAYPPRIADRQDNLDGPIVVGAVNNTGDKAKFSQELQYGRMLWAPGVDVTFADTFPDISEFAISSETSYAAPLVAGVVAEQLTDMNRQGLFHPRLRNQHIYEKLSWKRPSGLPVIWNREDGTQQQLKASSASTGTATA
ncbi:MAG: hypothetical protein Q9168_003857 [Polycauliona sp. 1 TL-2023]